MFMINCGICTHQRTLVIKDNGYFFINIIGYSICQSYAGDASCEDEGGEGGDG